MPRGPGGGLRKRTKSKVPGKKRTRRGRRRPKGKQVTRPLHLRRDLLKKVTTQEKTH